MTITVNGRTHEVYDQELSYTDVVRLAYDPLPSNWRSLTMVYSKAASMKSEGTLLDGDSVQIQAGTIFTVADTSNA